MEGVQKKGSLSGLEVRVLVKELGGLSGGYVSNIHSLGESQILRIKKSGGEDVSLVVSPKYGAWITQAPAQTATDEFTTSLRQELLRLKLDSVSQYELDRVMFFRFSKDDATLQLVLELMPPGNIILTDAAGRIMVSLRESKGTQRRRTSPSLSPGRRPSGSRWAAASPCPGNTWTRFSRGPT